MLETKVAGLDRLLRGIAGENGSLAVACSGGLDSRFLVHSALRAGLLVRALHVRGPHIPSCEHAFALDWAAVRNVPLAVVTLDPLSLPILRNNPTDRCYHCKTAVFAALRKAAGPLPLCDGTNASDLGEYRPGLQALSEQGIRSPLAEAGVSKADIRRMAAATGLENPDQAAQPCLLTRFAYGAKLTPELLASVDAAEETVRNVFAAYGQPNALFRVRFEDAATPALHLTREPLSPDLEAALVLALERSGFPGASLRRMDSLSGYFDRQ